MNTNVRLKRSLAYTSQLNSRKSYCYCCCNLAKALSSFPRDIARRVGEGRRDLRDRFPMARQRVAGDIIFFAPATGAKRHFTLPPARVMSLRHIAERNLPRSIDTSVHGAGKLSRPQSFALCKVPLSVERSTGLFCEKLHSSGKGERAAGRYYALSPSSSSELPR